jgi:hypothetical protein
MKNRIEMKRYYNVVAQVEVDGLDGKAEGAGLHSLVASNAWNSPFLLLVATPNLSYGIA